MNTPEKKIRIAIIIPGGIGTGHNNIGVPVLERLVKLLARDFQLTVFSLFKVNENYEPEGFELISISTSNSLLKIIKFLSTFKKDHRQKKFRVVHGFWVFPSGFLAIVMGKLFGIKSLVSVQGGDAISLPQINYGQLQRWLPRKLIVWTLTHADEVLLTSYLLNNLRKVGLKRDDAKIIPLGIDVSQFTFHEKPLSTPVQFLHIGNLNPVKDQETLLKAFKIIGDSVPSQLTIIGEGVLEKEVKLLSHQLSLKDSVIFLQPMPHENLPVHYHNADILLHTSLSEGHVMVVAEAMGSGVVVCGTNVGLLYDLPACCVAVPVRDFEMLGHEVLKLLRDPERMKKMRRNALEWATAHSIHWTTEQIKELYNP